MKRNVYYLSVLLLAGCMVGGCSDEQGNTANVPAASGEPIRFSVSTDNVKSRTVYDELEEDGWTLDWVTGDEIGIYTSAPSDYVKKSPNEGDRYAVYQISEVNPDGHQHEGSIAPLGTDQLVWGSQIETFTGTLDFYGAYPAERIVKYPSQDGTDGNSFEMQYWTNQKVTVTEKVDNVYKTEPDMKNAYMIAKQAVQPSGEHILLHFDPIMTTLNITITAGKYEVATGIINPVTVTGVSVIMPKALKDGQFVYQTDYTFKEDDDSFVTPGIHGGLKKGTVVDNKESVFVGVEWADEAEEHTGERFVDLFEGESITLMAFLPPVKMLENSGAKIKVHTTGALNFVLEVTPEMIQQSRIDIQLPDVSPVTTKANDWISQLNDSKLLRTLSIPGYECKKGDDSRLSDLLNMGIRAFDVNELRNGPLHGQDLPQEIKGIFNNFLQGHQKEFIILLYDGGIKDLGIDNPKFELTKDNWNNATVSNVRGGIISLKKAGYGEGHYEQEGVGNIFSDDNELPFGRTDINKDKDLLIPNSKWNVQYIDEEDATEIIKLNKTNYEAIIKTAIQEGCIGIVMAPYAGEIYADDTYTYSDLLIQSIIDCNYKFH